MSVVGHLFYRRLLFGLPLVPSAHAEIHGGLYERHAGAVVLYRYRLFSHAMAHAAPCGQFSGSLLGFYVLYLILELYFVNNRLHNVKENP